MSLEDVEAIKQLKARYFRLLDTKDWAALVEVFCEDCTYDVSADGAPNTVGRAQFVERIAKTLAGVVTVHHGHMPEIEITGRDTATGIWAMEDELWFPDGAPLEYLHGYGHYYETYRRDADGGWRIASMQLRRLRRDLTPREDT